ncbi:MAG: signal peptidase I [Verrucomicrobia bacterium]|nr:signal peptidase I [Verrucomicrobiota bacterium]
MKRRFDIASLPRAKRTLILACILFWSVLTCLSIRMYVAKSMIVEGDSMAPEINPGDRIIVLPLVYRFGDPQRGDLVAIQLPGDDDLTVKRIIALPEETVQIVQMQVWVNDKPLQEDYLPATVTTDGGRIASNRYQIAPSCYFVLGDNRNHSFDSRSIGAVTREQIVGRIHR